MNKDRALGFRSYGVVQWNDFARELDRFFNGSEGGAEATASSRQSAWASAYDVEEGEKHFLVTLDMPGIPKDQIKIEVMGGKMTVSGERPEERQSAIASAWRSERNFGKFHRTFVLPQGVEADRVEADYQDGVLRLCIPKAESEKPRQIKIAEGSKTGFFAKLAGQSPAA